MCISYFSNNIGLKLAFVHSKADKLKTELPALVFLGGFKSDMNGTKAIFLENSCRKRGQEFLRFDYSGHGQSEGEFVNGTIGRWLCDACDIITHVIESSEIIIVGSSMGGWIALRLLINSLSKEFPSIRGVIGVAAAPDFTNDIMDQFTHKDHINLEKNGYIQEDNEYGNEPYIFTKQLFEDGKKQSLLNPKKPYKTQALITLLQGKMDKSVHWSKAQNIQKAFDSPRTKIVFIDNGDHSLSKADNLALLEEQILSMMLFNKDIIWDCCIMDDA